jgi:hypothetical protein
MISSIVDVVQWAAFRHIVGIQENQAVRQETVDKAGRL